MKRFALAILICLGLSFTVFAAAPSGSFVKTSGTLHTMKLPEAPPVQLPPGKGRETVSVQCAVCHTLAYIPMQPPFSRETWTAEVTKMQKTYSAPIPDDKINEIVDYLMQVRGATPKK